MKTGFWLKGGKGRYDPILRRRHHRHLPSCQHPEHADDSGFREWGRSHHQTGEPESLAICHRTLRPTTTYCPHDMVAHILWQLPVFSADVHCLIEFKKLAASFNRV